MTTWRKDGNRNYRWHQKNRRRGERSAKNFARAQRKWFFNLLHRDRLAIAFQPIFYAGSSDEVFAYECLLRAWDGEALIYPDALFRSARVLDCTGTLDLAARVRAIEEVANHNPSGKIFINFAPCFGGGDEARRALRRTLAQLDDLEIARERIVFEITESDCLHDWEEGLDAIAEYRSAGFELALDDFGTGYSSLKLLHQVRPDYIKLDQSLLRDVHRDSCKAVIAGKVVEIARSLEIATIAEGIECAAESSWAHEQGVDFVQGFHFAVPAFAPLEEAAAAPERVLFQPFQMAASAASVPA